MINPTVRLKEISGPTSINPPYVNVTPDFMLTFGTLGPSVPIRDVMDIHSPTLCYTY
jgi:tyrosinase